MHAQPNPSNTLNGAYKQTRNFIMLIKLCMFLGCCNYRCSLSGVLDLCSTCVHIYTCIYNDVLMWMRMYINVHLSPLESAPWFVLTLISLVHPLRGMKRFVLRRHVPELWKYECPYVCTFLAVSPLSRPPSRSLSVFNAHFVVLSLSLSYIRYLSLTVDLLVCVSRTLCIFFLLVSLFLLVSPLFSVVQCIFLSFFHSFCTLFFYLFL